MQVLRIEEPEISRYFIALLHQHDVARNQLTCRYHFLHIISQHGGIRRHQALQRVSRGFRLPLLDEPDDRIGEYHGENDCSVHPHLPFAGDAQEGSDRGSHEEEIDQGAVELHEEPDERAAPLEGQLIIAILVESCLCLDGGQPCPRGL